MRRDLILMCTICGRDQFVRAYSFGTFSFQQAVFCLW